jgi:hypothetical protein
MKLFIHSLQEPPMSNQDIVQDAQAVQGRGIGVMFLAFFGSWWMAAGLNTIPGMKTSVLTGVALIGLGLFAAGWRQLRRAKQHTPTRQVIDASIEANRTKVFRNINIAQWSACIGLVVVLNILQRGEWIVPGIMLIVGVHFFPLAKLFRYQAHYVTGSALVALALSYPFLAAGGPASAVGPIGAALILWVSAAGMLVRAPRW